MTTPDVSNPSLLAIVSVVTAVATYVITSRSKGVENWRNVAEGAQARYEQERSANDELKAKVIDLTSRLSKAEGEISALKSQPDYTSVMSQLVTISSQIQSGHQEMLHAMQRLGKPAPAPRTKKEA